ncbi:hypothetical protein CLOM_g17726 [Closterium sp. NIES-68]|nr:hypothetical protein CLOM_g17726 [Closterium sp. NIES-68]GJP83527.1 hypothetical protein CLOP_g13670 [Closterium sp. NIES-67]
MAKRGLETEYSVLEDARGDSEETKRHKREKDEGVARLEEMMVALRNKVEFLEKVVVEDREASRDRISELRDELARERAAREEREEEIAALEVRLAQTEELLVQQRHEMKNIWEAIPAATNHHPTDEDIQIVNLHPETTEITLNDTWRLTMFGFIHLSCMRSLKSISIVGNLEKPALLQLYSMTWLEELKLESVTEPMVPEIKNLWALRHLELRDTPISGNGLANLAALSSLQSLVLSQQLGISFTSDTMVYVGKLGNLEHLDIANTQVCDYGLWCLAALVKLRWLSLPRSITYRGMEYLKSFKSLKTLLLRFLSNLYSVECLKTFPYLENVGVGDYQALERVQKALPNLNSFVIGT